MYDIFLPESAWELSTSTKASWSPEDVSLTMLPNNAGLLLDGQSASPNEEPDLVRALWRVQEQQLSSLDALRKLRSQHQEWQRTIQDMVRQVKEKVEPPSDDSYQRSSGQPDVPTATSPKLSNAADEASEATEVVSVEWVEAQETVVVPATSVKTGTDTQDPVKTQETENVIQTPDEPSHNRMLAPWQAFGGWILSIEQQGPSKKMKRFDDYSLFPSDWQRWIDHLVEKAERPGGD
eukprot:s422_g9.t1